MFKTIREIDFALLDLIQTHLRCGVLDEIMPAVSLCGNMGIFWVVLAVALSAKAKYRRCSITMLIGLIIGVLVGNLAIKNAVRRDRPCWINEQADLLIGVPQDFSFPSGHTLSSFAAAAILYYYNKKLGIPAFIVAGLIAFSRMYLYVHFPTDILAGILVGFAVAAVTVAISEKVIFPKMQRK